MVTKETVGLMGARRRVLKVLPQTGGRKNLIRDKGRGAMLPGKRISRSGKVYWETRKNRSDNIAEGI